MSPKADWQDLKNRTELTTLLLIAVWFGVVTGLVEGAGLMLFQRLNWASWGPMLHVSWPILWISPLSDVLFFLFLAGCVSLIARLIPRLPALPALVFLLSVLSVYNWLTVTARLYHRSCLLLAIGAATAFTRWFSAHREAVVRFWKRSVPWVIAAGALAFIGVQGGLRLAESRRLAELPGAASGSPNVLVIVIDTLRADHLSSYGYPRPTSPNIDRMAQQGTLFENAVSTSSWSFPSHVSLLTGRYEFEHGMGEVPRMPLFGRAVNGFRGFPTLGQALEQRGYRTAAFSANRTYFSSDLGFWQGMTHFEDYFHSPADAFVRTLYGREFSRIYLSRTEHSKPKRLLRWLGVESILDADEEGSGSRGGAQGVRKRATEVNRELLDWVGEPDGSQRPFFAVLNYFDVHAPYGGPRSFVKQWPQDDPVDLYDDSIRYVDDCIGQLTTKLAERGFGKNTLVVITSDHGESLGQHGLKSHGSALYREVIRVPLILWFPDQVRSDLRVTEEVSNSAIPATVMDLLRGSPRGFPGPTLSQFWRERSGHLEKPVALSELEKNEFLTRQEQEDAGTVPTATSGRMQSLVVGSWHLVVHETLGAQLYNWTQDPGELHDLSRTSDGQAVVETMVEALRDKMSGQTNAEDMSPTSKLARSLDEKMRQRMAVPREAGTGRRALAVGTISASR